MTRHNWFNAASAVHTGRFPDGPDSMLLNPDISGRRWRAERARAALRPRIVVTGLVGAALTVLASLSASGFAAV